MSHIFRSANEFKIRPVSLFLGILFDIVFLLNLLRSEIGICVSHVGVVTIVAHQDVVVECYVDKVSFA